MSDTSDLKRQLEVMDSFQAAMGPLADRDYLCMLDLAFDPEPQLRAIHGLLEENQKADNELDAEIRDAEEHARELTGIRNEYATNHCIDLMQHSVYQDASHSMSALGMLAPFIESIFTQCFAEIGRKYFSASSPPNGHNRWKANVPEAWDCHYKYVGGQLRKSAIVDGAQELAAEVGLQKYLQPDIWMGMTALFAYRNKMFHNGMEWPKDERQRFQKRIADENWPTTWFSQATSGGEPWVIYMTQEFIEVCDSAANQLLDAFGLLIKNELSKR